MGIVKTYPQLVGVRACLGVAEAGLFPGKSSLPLHYPTYILMTANRCLLLPYYVVPSP